MKKKQIQISSMYCVKCGNRGIPIARKRGAAREPGHLKKLYCLYCGEETNHCEIKPYGGYTLEDFLFEFNNNNFDKDGNRIHTFGELKNIYYKKLREEVDTNENDKRKR